MKKDSWDSEFRKKRFYENQRIKAEKKYNQQMNNDPFNSILSHKPRVLPHSIAIMMDLDGTCNHINDETAEKFISQVEALRQQFGGEKAYICISTHSSSARHIKQVFDYLAKYKNDDIILSNSFFYGGVYLYDYDEERYQGFGFNSNKVETFSKTYLENFALNIGWFAIIDDTLSDSVFKPYQEDKAMVGLRPGYDGSSKYDNFMYRSTATKNFEGVVELMDKYIEDIKDMSIYDIMDTQRKMQRHLSCWEVSELLRNYQFAKIVTYLNSGLADKDDFRDVYTRLYMMSQYENDKVCGPYRDYVEEILKILDNNGYLNNPIEEEKKMLLKGEEM